MKELKIVKLKNGEEILGEFDFEGRKVTHPVRVVMGRDGLMFMSWIAGSADIILDIDIERQILVVCDPAAEVKNAYNQQFGAGIVTASSMPPTPPPLHVA